MKRKVIAIGIIAMVMAVSCYGCKNKSNKDNSAEQVNDSTVSSDKNAVEKFDIDVTYSDKEKLSVSKSDLSNYSNVVTLNGESLTISESGEYVLSGEISDGQIIVDVPDSDDKVVTLILNGVNVSCSDSAAMYVKSAKKVVLSLVEGTTNTFTDGSNYTYDDEEKEEPNACIFSKDDLAISGEGTIIVNGKFNNGVYSKDDLTITGGKIEVKAVNNGIKGKDSIAVLTSDIFILLPPLSISTPIIPPIYSYVKRFL